MGLYYNISGAQFVPYDPVQRVNVRVKDVDPTSAVSQVHEFKVDNENDRDLTFQETLKKFGIRTYLQNQNLKPESKKAFRVHEIMNKHVQPVEADTSIAEIRKISATVDYQHWPIVDSNQKIIGMISDRDILLQNHVSELEANEKTVSDIMSSKLIVATEDTFIFFVAKAMLAEKIHAIPIVDENYQIRGLVTTGDILNAVVNQRSLELWG
jgi:CBS domain-containing protein